MCFLSIHRTDEFLDVIQIPRLTDEHLSTLESTIEMEETVEAIKSMKSNTALGLDGFTVECYKKFSETLQPILVNLFHACLDENKLPETWAESKIIVLPKPGKELMQLQSYMPISLLNCDYRYSRQC